MNDKRVETKTEFADRLLQVRLKHREGFPSKVGTQQFLDNLVELLFPQFCRESSYLSAAEITGALVSFERGLSELLQPLERQMSRSPEDVARTFFDRLSEVYELLWLDAQAIFDGDPAAESLDEVISAYPGFFAIFSYRVAHEFYRLDVPVFPRLLTEYAHRTTGVDIHPGAEIGRSFFIDHATGIVIGETCRIGDNVKLYQGVTLGALSVTKDMSNTKRHPTIEDNVIVYSNATILGGDTTIGHDSIIGGNSWLTSSIEPNSIVYNRAEIHVRSQLEQEQEMMFHI